VGGGGVKDGEGEVTSHLGIVGGGSDLGRGRNLSFDRGGSQERGREKEKKVLALKNVKWIVGDQGHAAVR